ncbi:MAG TPA: alpha/beta fold hydrolase [Terriglobales bacterium]|nr:alpha/beta fold hydrolase [Terriglobales bacterium]
MERIRSGDAEIAYEVLGKGAPVVLLHPFPADHEFWNPVSDRLATRYRVLLPDLRGHGDSGVGEGPATMEKHAADLARVCDETGIGRAVFVGVSIGGYILFEFWRRYRQRVRALVLSDTRPQADTEEGRANRLKAAEDVLRRGPEPFIDSMLPKLLGASTHQGRPDLVQAAKRMMMKMSPEDIAQVQRGMAVRPDSMETLKTINVPTLLLVGSEDTLTPVADAELMRENIAGSQLRVIPRGGHYALFEQSDATLPLFWQFLEGLPGN